MTHTLTPSQRLTAAVVEGLYWLTALCLRLAESTLLLTAFTAETAPSYMAAAVGALGYSLLLAPLRLGRHMWYSALLEQPCRTPPVRILWAGYRRWRGAVSWRWSRWWRLTALLLGVSFPAALLWGYGDRLTRLGNPTHSLLWLVLGGIALLGGLGLWCARRCRYCLVPLLLAQGYTAPLAMQLSISMTRRRTGQWINFWGGQLGRLILCVLCPPVALWLLPAIRLSYTALLSGWARQGACILPPVAI